jgi:hypothetical protein
MVGHFSGRSLMYFLFTVITQAKGSNCMHKWLAVKYQYTGVCSKRREDKTLTTNTSATFTKNADVGNFRRI